VPKPAPVTVDGAAVGTPYGPVQVRLTLVSGHVTFAAAIAQPGGSGTSEQINAYAIPILNQEAVAAGTAHVAMVSGATYTSGAYQQSLQSALDKA